jgi:predicted DNA-binding ribbon-helix-helix protein
MTAMTTVKLPKATRDRLRTAAEAEHLTQAALIDKLLAERAKAAFWSAMSAIDPAEYRSSLVDDDVDVDVDHSLEDAMIDAEPTR